MGSQRTIVFHCGRGKGGGLNITGVSKRGRGLRMLPNLRRLIGVAGNFVNDVLRTFNNTVKNYNIEDTELKVLLSQGKLASGKP